MCRPRLSLFLLSISAALVSLQLGAPGTVGQQPQVKIKNGTLLGLSLPALGGEAFLNIPYAQTTGGQNRLQAPKPVDASWTTRDATQWGNICPGVGISSTSNASYGQNYVLDEDCLNINIVRPAGTKKGDKLPVLFWIYGGGLVQGTANDPRYNGSYIVQCSVELRKPIIFASINYRLSAFGFPAGAEAANAGVLNLGARDQRQALHWVQENIDAFGGDPSTVTIYGQSAGGISVTLQMAAYGGRDDKLFKGAIADSGVFAMRNASLASQSSTWTKFVGATGCSANSDVLGCLRAVPYSTFYGAVVNTSYSPSEIPDGDFLLSPVWKAISDGQLVKVPFIAGNVKDEATQGIGAPTGIQTESALRSALINGFATLSPTNSTIDTLLKLYPDDPSQGCPFDTGDGVLGTPGAGLLDKRYRCALKFPMRFLKLVPLRSNAIWTDAAHAGTRHAVGTQSSNAPTWSFRFNQVPQNGTMEVGVAHLFELPYVFGVLNRTARNPIGYRAADELLSKTMQTYWINFVHGQDPNGEGTEVYWPSYHEQNPQNIVFLNGKIHVENDNYRKEGISFIQAIADGAV